MKKICFYCSIRQNPICYVWAESRNEARKIAYAESQQVDPVPQKDIYVYRCPSLDNRAPKRKDPTINCYMTTDTDLKLLTEKGLYVKDKGAFYFERADKPESWRGRAFTVFHQRKIFQNFLSLGDELVGMKG